MQACRSSGLAVSLLLVGILGAVPEASAKASDAPIAVPSSLAKGITLERVHRGLSKPVGLEFFPGDARKRLFVVEQTGTIRAIEKGKIADEPLLDISKEISTEHSEQGLLGLAFHPKFAKNRRLFVNFTDRDGATRVVEYKVSKGATLAVDKSTARLLVKIAQPWRNHNGGYLAFGPDGGLYVGMGDGGAAGDPRRAAQDPKPSTPRTATSILPTSGRTSGKRSMWSAARTWLAPTSVGR